MLFLWPAMIITSCLNILESSFITSRFAFPLIGDDLQDTLIFISDNLISKSFASGFTMIFMMTPLLVFSSNVPNFYILTIESLIS